MADFYQATVGSALTVDLDLLTTLEPMEGLAAGYPKVELVEDDEILQTIVASTGSPVTTYTALLNIPDLIDLTDVDFKNLRAVWRIQTVTGKVYKIVQTVQVIGRDDQRPIQRELVHMIAENAPQDITVLLDFALSGSDPAPQLDIYFGNAAVVTGIAASTSASRGESSTATFSLSTATTLEPKFVEYNLIVRGTRSGQPYTVYCPLFITNPSIQSAIEQLRHFLSKARVSNQIASLNFTEANLFSYLQRGLDWFNGFPPAITTFNGTNMMGAVRNGWLFLSQYVGLLAQYGAENDLDFEFSGQSVTLRVGRKDGIETMLSRIDAELERTIKPLKSLLAKGGTTGGDGSGDGQGNFGPNAKAVGSAHVGNHSMINWNGRGGNVPFLFNWPYARRM